MRTHEEIAELSRVARTWVGTPFAANSAVKGGGVCCHRFVGEVYFEAGWLPRFALPDGYPYGSGGNSDSRFETYLDASQYFDDVDPARRCNEDALAAVYDLAQPGDLLLSRPGRLPWHLAINLGFGFAAHVCIKHGVQVSDTFPDAWSRRVARIFRPI